MLPISSKIKRHRHKKDENVTKTKLPTQATSKDMKKCPICGAPFKDKCTNCHYTLRRYYEPMKAPNENYRNLFKKANESYRREKSMEL